MKYYSFAGAASGKTDPDETHVYTYGGADCDRQKCGPHCEHTVFMWSGNEYSKDHTWIAAEKEFILNLEEAR